MRKTIAEEETLEIPIVPLIDIGFELIVFFVLTASQAADLVDEEVNLAQAKHSPAQTKPDKRAIIINVRGNGEINIMKQPQTVPQLTQVLKAAKRQSGDTLPIVIRVDGKAKYKEIDRIMEAVGKAGLYKVSIAASKEE